MRKTLLVLALFIVLSTFVYAQCDDIKFNIASIKESDACFSDINVEITSEECGTGPCFQEFNGFIVELDTGVEKTLFVPRNAPATMFLNELDCSQGKPSKLTLHLDAGDYKCSESFSLGDDSKKAATMTKARSGSSDFWLGLGIIVIIILVGLAVYLLLFYDKKPKRLRYYRYK
ncbi:hypothetical protein HN419_05890 [Candidatus Woesearchaeota archaeon]|jgi:hypothetical protein|nr:hypothetical protein [Candidatus Woesearchaeota archaeon]MBT7928721.1 hypothetical protein [Candidatus Peregrinibacteria bacterium]MBT3537598.1 hypothetical protein [Candidatus Woesearchaeota archaeon]MBT4696900.1 hypothetical protein [Candidatus Woesearchaeota archaeon]MBT4716420.1 hypothetical protein [Candidatus Woesearchaeota archaeon]